MQNCGTISQTENEFIYMRIIVSSQIAAVNGFWIAASSAAVEHNTIVHISQILLNLVAHNTPMRRRSYQWALGKQQQMCLFRARASINQRDSVTDRFTNTIQTLYTFTRTFSNWTEIHTHFVRSENWEKRNLFFFRLRFLCCVLTFLSESGLDTVWE